MAIRPPIPKRVTQAAKDFGTAVRAFDPVTKGGTQARAQVRQNIDRARSEGRTTAANVASFVGPPTTRGGAVAQLALAPLGVGAGKAAAVGSRAAVQAGLARTIAPVSTRTLAAVAPRAASRTAMTAAKATPTLARRVAQKATSAARKGVDIVRRNPGKTALGVLGGAIVIDALSGDPQEINHSAAPPITHQTPVGENGPFIPPGTDGTTADGTTFRDSFNDDVAGASTGILGHFGGLDAGAGLALANIGEGLGKAAAPAVILLAVAAAVAIVIAEGS